MIFEVVFTKKANETFDAICSQLLERWDEKVVAEFERRTLKVIDKYLNIRLYINQ